MKPYVHLVEELLRMNCKVLVYNGQNDLIVQTPGTFKWAERVHYDNAEEFRNTLFSTWKVGNRTAGYKKQVGLYELKTVNNAGHLVPMDQGAAATQLLKDFVVRSLAMEEPLVSNHHTT
jgi:serine carboxypeptidase 1